MQKLNNLVAGFLLISMLMGSTGCSILSGGKNKNANKEEVARGKVEKVESLMGYNLKDKLEQVASFTYGVDYALSKEEDPSRNVKVAKDLNSRTMSLSGVPTIEEIKKMEEMIDKLISDLEKERIKGEKALEKKDGEIQAIQEKSKLLEEAKDEEIRKYMKIAQDTASRADSIQTQLDKMNSYMGLGAIWYGFKRLVTSLAWILGIGSVLFIILRFASLTNPFAASIFSIFTRIGSWAVNIIQLIVPKAVELAGHTTTAIFNVYKSTLVKIVDAIQMAKSNAKASGKEADLKGVLDEVAKSMNTEEKAIVDELKKAFNWQ